MTTPPETVCKVQQLNNDVVAIYEMLTRVEKTQQRHGNRLDELAGTQAEHTATLAEHGTILAEHGTILVEHTATLAEHGTKLDRIIDLLQARP